MNDQTHAFTRINLAVRKVQPFCTHFELEWHLSPCCSYFLTRHNNYFPLIRYGYGAFAVCVLLIFITFHIKIIGQ